MVVRLLCKGERAHLEPHCIQLLCLHQDGSRLNSVVMET